jgi:hypothetical protein
VGYCDGTDTIARGLIAGEAGTTALNIVTWLDVAVRARPASSAPGQTVQRLADVAGVTLVEGMRAEQRTAGLGPPLGYATGLSAAVCYALAARRRPSWPTATLPLTVLAMIGSDAPMTPAAVHQSAPVDRNLARRRRPLSAARRAARVSLRLRRRCRPSPRW